MFRYLSDTVGKHILMKLGLGLVGAVTAGAVIDHALLPRLSGYANAILPAAVASVVIASLIVVGRRAAQPLHDIEKALESLAQGETDIRLSGLGRRDEFGRLSSALLALRDTLQLRYREERELRESLLKTCEVLKLAPTGILVERDGIVVACNPRLEETFGYAQGELVGAQCGSLYAENSSYTKLREYSDQARTRGEAYSAEAELRRKDGTVFWGALSCNAGGATAEDACRIWVYSDISRTKLVEAEMTECRVRLEKLVADRTRQLGEARQIAERAFSSAASDVFGHLNTMDAVIEPVPFDPARAVSGVAAMFMPRVDEKGLELVLDIESKLPSTILGDPLRISQVLCNLLTNAIRATRQGAIVMAVREIKRDREKVCLQFSVLGQGAEMKGALPTAASGTAISIDDRAETRRGDARLGLAIAKRVVDLMGGTLQFEFRYDRGCIHHFTAEFQLVERGADKATVYADQLKSLAGGRVMVIDDSPSARLATAAAISKLGLVPVLFGSGQAALASLLQPESPRYLFICIDRRMPVLDGIAVARRMQTHFGGGCPPLFLMSAFNHSCESQKTAHGFAAVISKPVTVAQMFSSITASFGISAPASTKTHEPRLKGKRTLVVHGSGAQREIITDFLREAGAKVRVAGNTVEALQAVREAAPDCVVIDCRMPGLAAYEASGNLRALGYTRLPVIGLWAGASPTERAACLAAGMSDLMTDPINLPALAAILAKWLMRPLPNAPTAEAEALPPLPPELDVATGLRHLRGKTGLFLKALRMFRDSCGQQFQLEFSSAVRAGDWQTSARLAQSLKGTAATIGANHVSEAAARLETAIRACNYAEANAMLKEVTEKLRVLVDGLAHIG